MTEWSDTQEQEWQKIVDESLSRDVCPYSGEAGPKCKATVCDCWEFEDKWGVSRK